MNIIVHRTEKIDILEARETLMSLLYRLLIINNIPTINVKFTNYRSVINDVIIEYRCGKPERMAGVRTDYYSSDDSIVVELLKQSACKMCDKQSVGKCCGKQLDGIFDVYTVVEEYLLNKEEMRKEKENEKK